MTSFYHFKYDVRLKRVGLRELHVRREYHDKLSIRKIMSHLMSISLDDCGLHLVSHSTSGNSKCLVSLRPSFVLISESFSYRASKTCNTLPLQTININNLASFKKMYINCEIILRYFVFLLLYVLCYTRHVGHKGIVSFSPSLIKGFIINIIITIIIISHNATSDMLST